MIIEIRGHDLPGGSCGPTREGGEYVNIHVGLARRNDTVDLSPATRSPRPGSWRSR